MAKKKEMQAPDQGIIISHLRKYSKIWTAIVIGVLFVTVGVIKREFIEQFFTSYIQPQSVVTFIVTIIGAFLGALLSFHIGKPFNAKLLEYVESFDPTAYELTKNLRKMGIEQIYGTREQAFSSDGLINYLPIFEKATKRFFMGAITLDTAYKCFHNHRGAKEKLKEKLINTNFEFKIITANPYDVNQMETVIAAQIERGKPADETITSLNFFLDLIQEHAKNREEHIKVSNYLPSHFFLLADDELYVQGYMDGEQSFEGLTIKLKNLPNSDHNSFNHYLDTFNSHYDKGSKPWVWVRNK